MNRAKRIEAEERFYMQYLGGFSNPLMMEVAKKYKGYLRNSLIII